MGKELAGSQVTPLARPRNHEVPEPREYQLQSLPTIRCVKPNVRRNHHFDARPFKGDMVAIPVSIPANFLHAKVFMNRRPAAVIVPIHMPIGGEGECRGHRQAKAQHCANELLSKSHKYLQISSSCFRPTPGFPDMKLDRGHLETLAC